MKAANKRKQKNRGSMTVEITLLMPLILWVLVLAITMFLSVLQQAQTHAGLMLQYAASDETAASGTQIYTEETELELASGYGITSEQEHTVRYSDIEKRLRRWQILGELVED